MNDILRNSVWYDKDNKNIIADVYFTELSMHRFWDSLVEHYMLYSNMTVGEFIEKIYSVLGKNEPKLAPIAYGYGWPDLRDFSVEPVEDMKDIFTIKINKVYIVHD